MSINSKSSFKPSFRLLRTLMPHTGHLPRWHVFDPVKNSLVTFKSKTRAVAYISIQTGELQETSPPFKDYEYIVYDRRGTRKYSPSNFCFTGEFPPADIEIFHFVALHSDDELSPKLQIDKIRSIAEKHKIILMGNDSKIEQDFQVVQTFLNRALDTKHDAFRYYPLTELAEIIRLFTRQHLQNPDKFFNHNVILLGALHAGVHFKLLSEEKLASQRITNIEMQIAGLYMPRVLTGAALDYTQEQFFQSRFFKKRGPQNRRIKSDTEKSAVKKAKADEIEREDYNGLTFWEHMDEVMEKVNAGSAQESVESV